MIFTSSSVKLRVLRGYIFLLLFLLPVLLQAQNSDEETRFIQRLTWTGDEYARRYEVVIEKEEAGTYRELMRVSTQELFIEAPLLPGKYRCMVIPYNILEIAGEASAWMYIEVIAALNPELDNVFFRDTRSGSVLYEMQISGKNLIPGAEILLRGPGGELIVPIEIQTDRGGARIRLFFRKDQLVAGDYELIVINPGGLQASRSGISFPPAEKVDNTDIFLSAAWMPSFTIYDRGNSFFGQDMSLAGATVRFGVVSAESYLGFSPGLELAASICLYDPAQEDEFHLWGVGLNFLILKRLPGNRTAFTLRLGAGYSAVFQTNIGVSFLLFVMDNWYLETGIDYAHWFTDIYPYPSSFRPWIGVGFSK
jgi:hypothetical protein